MTTRVRALRRSDTHRGSCAVRTMMARQIYMHERYLEAMGTSGLDARRALDQSRDDHDLETWFSGPAVTDQSRRPPRPSGDPEDLNRPIGNVGMLQWRDPQADRSLVGSDRAAAPATSRSSWPRSNATSLLRGTLRSTRPRAPSQPLCGCRPPLPLRGQSDEPTSGDLLPE